jgi:hypothetical protein
MDTPGLVFFWMCPLKLVQQFLKDIIVPVKPGSQLSELALGSLLNRFHLTYLLLIKNSIYFQLTQK